MVPRLALVLLVWLITGGTAAADVSGIATVIDGDTIEIAGERVRLHGIDAPETAQTCAVSGVAWPCGRGALLSLSAAVGGRAVTCVGTKRDRYGRLLAVCYAGSRNLNAEMVREGWALAYRQYAVDYVGEENEARAAGRGLWRGHFDAPWEWRRGERSALEARP